MRVIERLSRREATWRELDALLYRIEGRRPGGGSRNRMALGPSPWIDGATDESPRPGQRTLASEEVIRLAELYRSACADLMLAEAHDLPRDTVAYLHALVARAHNALYRARGFRFRQWAAELFGEVPRRLRSDPLLRLSAMLFYGVFLVVALLTAAQPELAVELLGEEQIEMFDEMYSQSIGSGSTLQRDDAGMAGFYVLHNASIGLQCFASGLIFGVGTIFILVHNALTIGGVFGHMATSPHAANFFTFVTAHAPFELTAIVFSGAAGLRLGSGLIITRGMTRLASLRREAVAALPTVGAAVFLFVLAAFLEGFVSASPLPYFIKAAIAIVSAGMLIVYLTVGGRTRGQRTEDRGQGTEGGGRRTVGSR